MKMHKEVRRVFYDLLSRNNQRANAVLQSSGTTCTVVDKGRYDTRMCYPKSVFP